MWGGLMDTGVDVETRAEVGQMLKGMKGESAMGWLVVGAAESIPKLFLAVWEDDPAT